jgi:hypothetical protein
MVNITPKRDYLQVNSEMKKYTFKLSMFMSIGILLNVIYSFKSAYAISNSVTSEANSAVIKNSDTNNSTSNLIDGLKFRNTSQSRQLIATEKDGLCTGVFKHTTGDVYFNYDPVLSKLAFGFNLSPGSQLILGSTVRVAMVQAVVNYYKINPPYSPHVRQLPYDFHGSISSYNRMGSKASFRVRSGDTITFTWLASGRNAKAVVLRAVGCKIP